MASDGRLSIVSGNQLENGEENSDIHRQQSVQGFNLLTACHTVCAFSITSLIGLLGLKYQHKNFSPFDTHPRNMNAFIASLIVYCMALAATMIASPRHRNYSKVFGQISLFSGALSSLSLASVFLSQRISWIVIIIVVIVGTFALIILQGSQMIKDIYGLLVQRTKHARSYVITTFTRFIMRHRSFEEQDSLA